MEKDTEGGLLDLKGTSRQLNLTLQLMITDENSPGSLRSILLCIC